jgi:hypothetical protein
MSGCFVGVVVLVARKYMGFSCVVGLASFWWWGDVGVFVAWLGL